MQSKILHHIGIDCTSAKVVILDLKPLIPQKMKKKCANLFRELE